MACIKRKEVNRNMKPRKGDIWFFGTLSFIISNIKDAIFLDLQYFFLARKGQIQFVFVSIFRQEGTEYNSIYVHPGFRVFAAWILSHCNI